MFAKNGTDATTTCVTIARAATERRKVLVAEGAYHGAAPWCTPDARRRRCPRTAPTCCTSVQRPRVGDRRPSTRRRRRRRRHRRVAVQARRPPRPGARRPGVRRTACAASATTPARRSSSTTCAAASASPTAAAGSRSASRPTCRRGARRSPTATRSPPCSATTASAPGPSGIFVTGSFWFSAVPMAAAMATIDALGAEDAVASMERSRPAPARRPGRAGGAHGVRINQTGPVQMPLLTFAGDERLRAGRHLDRRRRPPRRLLPPVAQLVPVGRPHRRRHRRGARGDRRGVRRGGGGPVRASVSPDKSQGLVR